MLRAHCVLRSPYGEITIRWAGGVLKSVELGEYHSRYGGQTGSLLPCSPAVGPSEDFPLIGQLNDYFRGASVHFDVPLYMEGHTDFERVVWETARRIPYGEVRSYGWIASEIGKPTAARAVGGAIGRNPFALVVPCHRVVGSDGKLTGFGAGLAWKRTLLKLEGIGTDGERICGGIHKIAIGSDHAGFELKERIKAFLDARGAQWQDFGTDSADSTDYPDYGFPVAEAVARGAFDRGILICGTGIGMSIAANKVRGIRAALCTSPEMAEFSRRHNDANILTLGGRVLSPKEAMEIVDVWLKTAFEGNRHARRLGKIQSYEKEQQAQIDA